MLGKEKRKKKTKRVKRKSKMSFYPLLLGVNHVVGLPCFVPAERRLDFRGGLVQFRVGQVNVQKLCV